MNVELFRTPAKFQSTHIPIEMAELHLQFLVNVNFKHNVHAAIWQTIKSKW